MARKKHKINKYNDMRLPLIDIINEESRDYLKALLHTKPVEWRGMPAIPPGTILDIAIRGWHTRTCIALELVLFTLLHHIAHWLLSLGTYVEFAGCCIYPDIWSIILAPSGAGKTFTEQRISSAMRITDKFPEITSAAKFIEDLEQYNNRLLIVDEFAQLLKKMDTLSHLVELKGYLLRTYDHSAISRRTKKAGITTIEKPMLSIMGLNVTESFLATVSLESMIDGFSQRFAYVIADKDPSRPFINYPVFKLQDTVSAISIEWDVLKGVHVHTAYTVDRGADAIFDETFRFLITEDSTDIPESFYRRILWRGIQYALLYHYILKKDSSVIDAEDMAWGLRLCELGLQDGRRLIIDHGVPELARKILQIEKLAHKLGRVPTPREVVQYVHGIKSVAEAKQLIPLIYYANEGVK